MNPVVQLFVLAIPIACVARTVVYEEIFREVHNYCVDCSQRCRGLMQRKFFYLFTCEYCFSHYITAAFLVMTRYHLMYDDWRGYVIAFFSLVFVANIYLSLYARIKVGITSEKHSIEIKKRKIGD